ncbi:T9SS type B sorting domain-containing protein [Pedobacter changchengzhani]|uniref:T9SS type B sorting domain-containing protein n=1 Tax=Pedobacter changchengzhani TaxID=2529274 RepID=A0A4R5MMG1_9SPHI|nr:gliding motility-associated C-terminal domain-containing protein [Pedobacter changchengzhani]TDG36319.1 T9SS type B sorting domain-containing protein [Pedobacter changchengzhani]
MEKPLLICFSNKRHFSFFKKILFISLLGVFCQLKGFGQSSPEDFDGLIRKEVNDLYLKIIWGDLPMTGAGDSYARLKMTNFIGYQGWNYYYGDVEHNNGYRSYPAGSSSSNIGPYRDYNVQIYYEWGKDCSGCTLKWGTVYRSGTTPKLKAITNLNVTDQVFPLLTWAKGSNIDDSKLNFEVYRNGNYITKLAGNVRNYTDKTVPSSGNYVYSIRTVLSSNAPSDWNHSGNACEPAFNASSFNYVKKAVTATTDQAGRVKLTWPSYNSTKGIGEIIVYKDGEQLINLSESAKTYSDSDVIPGMYYSYTIGFVNDDDDSTPAIDENFRLPIVDGKSLPNGKISGYIKGKTNAGSEGIVVTATSKLKISDNKNSDKYTYSDTTDASGYYQILNVFYGNGADYVMTPAVPGYTKKRFNPDSLSRKLTYDDANKQNVDFTDTASFAISGKVYFTAIKDSLNNDVFLPLQDAEVWIDGKFSTLTTKSDGSYNLGISTPGPHAIQIKFKDHRIDFAGTTDTIRTVNVNKLINDFNFVDNATETLTIKVTASCDAPIGEYVTLKLNSLKTGTTNVNGPPQPIKYGKLLHVSSYDWDKGNPRNPGQQKMGEITMVLPATGFEGQIVQVYENTGINSNKLEYFTKTYNLLKVDLAQKDTTKNIQKSIKINTIPADTTFRPDGSIYKIVPSRKDSVLISDTTYVASVPKMEFIYHDKLQLLINGGNPAFADSVRFNPGGVYKYLLVQNDKHVLDVKIRESYSYRDVNYACILDTGDVYIYDAISDLVDRKEYKLDSLTHAVKYKVKVGAPVLEAPYQKTIQIVGKVGSREANQIISVVVEGERARSATFVTKTPEIPLFVLHDPPGDKSFATISKGTTMSTKMTTQYAGGAGGGAYTDLKIGVGAVAPISGEYSAAVQVTARVEAGADKSSSTSTTFTNTFTEDFSTSGEETLVGADGDVYVGASMNMVYALTDILKYDAVKMDMVRDTALAADLNNFNTTFLYTEYHIKNILLKQLETLYSISKNTFDVTQQKFDSGDKSITIQNLIDLNRSQLEYKASIAAWQKALANNKTNRDKAGAVKLPVGTQGVVGDNISLSAGAVYDNSISMESDTTSSSEVSVYLNGEITVGGVVKSGAANEKTFGGLATFRFNWSEANETSAIKTTTTSYHLEDNDLGDFISIDLKKDKVYGTPVFKVISGSTSCPHEDNTQYRHLPAMQVSGASEQRNVPSDQAAKFEILISNRSESDETVEYAIKLNPLSNPNGARVLVGGQDVTNGQATYFIPTGKSFKLPVEVFRGPLSSVYEDLSLVIFSTCDNTLDDISDANIAKPSVKINAYFQNKCSDIDLFVPGNNWLVNQSNSNKLFVAFSKYDASAASPLTTVGLQYRKINQDYENSLWQTVVTVPKSDLKDKYYDYTFDVSTLPDGKYEIRSIAVCQSVDVNYSPVYSGTIDRVSAVAFGLPTPANGILTSSDVVGVKFNKDIVYTNLANPVKVILKRKDNGQIIPATVTGDGRTFIVKTIPESAMSDYENVELTAIVKNLLDLSGNKVADSVKWDFVVNLSPVYWAPTNVNINAIENVQSNFSAKLKNKSALVQDFSIVKYPAWLTPSYKAGKLVPLGEQNIDFIIDKNLNTGTYTDTVITMADNKRQLLYVIVNVLRTPPNWTVNPSNFKYNMSLTTQFSLNATDTLTSIDVRDKMGVFVGDECRGVADITYDANSKKYVAFITAYSNAANESLSVHFWDTYPGIEYQGLERINFVPNGTVGSADNTFILHPEGVYQTIPLKKGWTWISLNVKNSDMSLKKVLASLKPTEGDVIKTLNSNNVYSQYNKKLGWAGSLDSLNVYNSYMIYLAKPDSLRVLGQFITKNVNVQLNKGWNWAGYPLAVNMELKNYLKNYKPADGSQMVSQEEFAQYNAASDSWSGSLKYLRPGKGYKFYSNGDGFTIPAVVYDPEVNIIPMPDVSPIKDSTTPLVVNNSNTIINSTVNNNMSVNSTNYETNMSVTSVINQGGQIVNDTTNRYETYVYVNNNLVNIVNQTTLQDGQAVGFIPVTGNTGDENKNVVIKVYDKEEKKEYTAKVTQPITNQGDNIIGTIAAPITLVLEGNADIMVSNQISKIRVNVGDTLKYTLTNKNMGPDLAVNTVLIDTLSKAFEFVSASSDVVYDFANHTIKINTLKIAVNESVKSEVILRALKVGTQTLGKGKVTVNNDGNLSNNLIPANTVFVVDKRASEAKILIPTLFTPNGDGINDVFEIVGLNDFYVSNSLTIFNKSYNIVYKKQNYQNDWNGDTLPMGSYGYILKAVDKDGKEVTFRGFITIVYQ